jgi:hypothetical protein
MGEPEFPQTRTTNFGRQITVDRSEDDDAVLVFSVDGTEIAELHQPAPGGPPRTDGMAEWPLRFEAYQETTVLGPPDDPPIADALFSIDVALDATEEDI